MNARKPTDLVVFLGPSLPAREARAIARCHVLPPARQGDVWRALALRPRAIALVDGVFESVPSVWHHELLAALDAGVAVLGASSMGALRAAELWRHGMVGVGRIFALYRDGKLTDDSEVALLHAGPEHGFEAFTVPLVNVRHNAERAARAGVLAPREAKALVGLAERTFFQERTWERVLQGLSEGARARWDRWARTHLEDLKALDARACLSAADALLRAPASGARVDASRTPPSHVRRRRLHEGASRGPEGEGIANGQILARLAARADAPAATDAGLRALLLAGWARELGLKPTAAEVREAERAFWSGRAVAPKARAEYLARCDLDAAEARRFFETLALERGVLDRAARMISDGPSADEALAFESRRRGLWAATAAPRSTHRRSRRPRGSGRRARR